MDHRTRGPPQGLCRKIADRKSLMIPAEDPGYEDLGQAFPASGPAAKDAILKPPRPMINPSARVIEHPSQPGLPARSSLIGAGTVALADREGGDWSGD
jgi:hypothetical protein